MPFGVIFAALVLGILCPWYGLSAATSGGAIDRAAGVAWAVAGLAIAASLLLRRRGSRACGIAAALLLAVEGVRLVLSRGEPLEAVLLFAGLMAATLLMVSKTGAVAARSSSADGLVALPRARGIAAMAATIGLCAIVGWSVATDAALRPRAERASGAASHAVDPMAARAQVDGRANPGSAPQRSRALTAAAEGREGGPIAWTTFADGLASAKSRKTPMFVEFYATWCGACRSMDRGTFRDAAVTRRLEDVVAVRVDAEEAVARGGVKGVDLANRFRVEAYPTLLVLDSGGKELARLVGAPGASAFLRWLDDALAPESGSRAAAQDKSIRVAQN